MTFEEWAEEKTRKLTVWDIALIKWSCLVGGVFLSRVVPALRNVDTRALGVISLALAAKPAVTALRTTNASR